MDLSKLHRWHKVNGGDESLLNKRTPPGTRSPSPEPLVPLSNDGIPLTRSPAPHKPFTQLTPREQLACFTHILQLIILDKYEPTHELNIAWMAGGKSRQAVQLRAGMKGNLTDSEGSIVTAQVRRWALRDERWASAEERKALQDAIQDEPIDILQKPEDQNIIVQVRSTFSSIQRVPLTYFQGRKVTCVRGNGHGSADSYLASQCLHSTTSREPSIRIPLSDRPIRLHNRCSNTRSHSTASPLAKWRSGEELPRTAPQPANRSRAKGKGTPDA